LRFSQKKTAVFSKGERKLCALQQVSAGIFGIEKWGTRLKKGVKIGIINKITGTVQHAAVPAIF